MTVLLNQVQEREVLHLMKKEGYTNKADFIRFLVRFYKESTSPSQKNLEKKAREVRVLLRKLKTSGKLDRLGDLHQQLADV